MSIFASRLQLDSNCSLWPQPLFQMLRLICVFLYCVLARGQTVPPPLPFGVTPPVPYGSLPPFTPGIPPVAPTIYPLGPNARPSLPGYNNPYYNPNAGPAIPILTYSNDHGADGTYSYRFVCPQINK